MKGRLRPPFALSRAAAAQWHAIQDELPTGTFRGVLSGEHEVWRAALAAEWQSQFVSRYGLPDNLLDSLRQFRTGIGLEPLPVRK
jgi:hypothetical protein